MPIGASGAVRAGRAFVELFADDRRLQRGLNRARAKLKAWGASVTALGRRLVTASAAGLTPIALALRTFASFSDQMSKVRAVTQSTDADFNKLNETAKELGRTTSFTASEVAAAMVELGKAGFKPREIDQAIGAMLSLARATDTDLATSAEIAGNALRIFNLDAREMGRVADVLTQAANSSATTVEDLGEGLKYVGPLAVEAGSSLEDVAAAMGILANNGIKGTLAGNALGRAYKNLSTDRMQKFLKTFGVDAVDAAGDLRPLAQIIAEIGAATEGLGSAKRLSIFEQLFGRGQAAALKLAGSGSNLADMTRQMQQAGGVAQRTAKQMDDNLGGSYRKLNSAAEGVAIAIGEVLSDTVRGWMDAATRALEPVTEWIKANKDLVTSLVKAAVVVGLSGAALIALGATLKLTAFALGGFAVVLKAVVLSFALLKAAALLLVTPFGLVTAAAVGLGVVIAAQTSRGRRDIDALGQRFGRLKDDAIAAWAGIRDAMTSGDMKLAADIAFGGIRLAFEEFKAEFLPTWDQFWLRLVAAVANFHNAMPEWLRRTPAETFGGATGPPKWDQTFQNALADAGKAVQGEHDAVERRLADLRAELAALIERARRSALPGAAGGPGAAGEDEKRYERMKKLQLAKDRAQLTPVLGSFSGLAALGRSGPATDRMLQLLGKIADNTAEIADQPDLEAE